MFVRGTDYDSVQIAAHSLRYSSFAPGNLRNRLPFR